MESKDCYIPGNVNIGRKEKARRIQNGWIYIVLAILAFVLMVFFDLPRIYRLLIYIPATMSALGFLQARESFCVLYGLKGEYRMDNERNKVIDSDQLSVDRKSSINIIIVALSVGLAATILAYLFF